MHSPTHIFRIFVSMCLVSLLFPSITMGASAIIADHTTCSKFDSIPAARFQQIRSTTKIFYGHTSHGSQIVTGLQMLRKQEPSKYAKPTIREADGIDLGDSAWVTRTRTHLADYLNTNVVIWSWCGQLSWYTTQQVNQYLSQMNELEQAYPNVTFIYMTGHLDGNGPRNTLYKNNRTIRTYCRTRNKVLFDFADIESYNPNGAYFPFNTDACEWCLSWCETNTCPSCVDCAHSHCFNCFQKGKAFWWLLARLTGWES